MSATLRVADYPSMLEVVLVISDILGQQEGFWTRDPATTQHNTVLFTYEYYTTIRVISVVHKTADADND